MEAMVICLGDLNPELANLKPSDIFDKKNIRMDVNE